MTAVGDEVAQSEPGAELTAEFKLRLIDSYGNVHAPSDLVRLTAELSGAATATTTPRVVNYDADTGFALVRVGVMLEPMEDATLTLTAAVAVDGVSLSSSAQVSLRAAAPRTLTSLLFDGVQDPTLMRDQVSVRQPVVMTADADGAGSVLSAVRRECGGGCGDGDGERARRGGSGNFR